MLIVMHGRSRISIDPRIPAMPGRSASGFTDQANIACNKRSGLSSYPLPFAFHLHTGGGVEMKNGNLAPQTSSQSEKAVESRRYSCVGPAARAKRVGTRREKDRARNVGTFHEKCLDPSRHTAVAYVAQIR